MKELEEEIRELQHQSQHLTFLCSQYLQSVDPTFKWNEVRLGVYDMADLTNALEAKMRGKA